MALDFIYRSEYSNVAPVFYEDRVSKRTEVLMSTIFDNHLVKISGDQLTYQSVDYQGEISLLEARIQILEEENARLQESLQFFLEICCGDE